jgi:toxin ParE2
MKIRFLEEAQREFDEAIEFYNQELPGLGNHFLQEVLGSIQRIAQFPDAWHPLSENTRRCQTRKFPYGLIYSNLENEILIISVSNLHREPTHWKDRVK